MPALKNKKPKSGYDSHRDKMAVVSRSRSEGGREIGPLPKVSDKGKRRKKKCKLSLRAFCTTYFAARFYMGWSDDQLKVLAKLEAAIRIGGLFALAMPRASGKTTIAECAALWAILYGHRRFVVLIGATDDAACEMLDSLKMAIETSDELGEDFPEACYPIRALEGGNNRANMQTLDGVRTRISWTADEACFPTVKGSAASGSRIRVAGITGRIRGMKAAQADGKTIRPDFAIADDPQTDVSAVSLPDIDKREKRLRGAVKGLAGPGKTIAMVVPCTVIAPGDLSDRILDRERNPQFQGERMRMIYVWPTNRKLWDDYAEVRRTWLQADRTGPGPLDFYREHQAAMDAGAVVAWPERFDPETELSGLQAAMNLHIDNPKEFAAEYQNDPEPDLIPGQLPDLDPGEIAKRLNNAARGDVQPEFTRLTASIDVGGKVLYWVVTGWAEGFLSGAVLDYGVFPKQNRNYFTSDDARPALKDMSGSETMDETARIYAGLRIVVDSLMTREFPRIGFPGHAMKIDKCLVDAGDWTDTIHQFCRQSSHATRLIPSKGVGVSTTGSPMPMWGEKSGEVKDPRGRWIIRPVSGSGRGREVLMDTNHWKSFMAARLTTPMGGAGCLTLFGSSPDEHRLFADHLCAEYRVSGQNLRSGLVVEEWKKKPGRPDNHWLDTLYMACVAASMLGVQWAAGMQPEPKKKRVMVSMKEMAEQAAKKNTGAAPVPNFM